MGGTLNVLHLWSDPHVENNKLKCRQADEILASHAKRQTPSKQILQGGGAVTCANLNVQLLGERHAGVQVPHIANVGVFIMRGWLGERVRGWVDERVGGREPRQGYSKCSSELDGRGQLRTSR